MSRARGSGRCLLALAAAALIGLPAGIAAANSAAPIEKPGRIAAPRFTAPSPLVVEEEQLSFRCDDGPSGPQCGFEARYRVKNPTAEPRGGIAAFYSIRGRGVVVLVDRSRPRTRPRSTRRCWRRRTRPRST